MLFTVLLEGVQIFPEINVGRLLNICVSVFQQTQPNTRQKTGPFKTYPVNIDNLPDSTKLTDQTHKHSISFTLKHAQHKLVINQKLSMPRRLTHLVVPRTCSFFDKIRFKKYRMPRYICIRMVKNKRIN